MSTLRKGQSGWVGGPGLPAEAEKALKKALRAVVPTAVPVDAVMQAACRYLINPRKSPLLEEDRLLLEHAVRSVEALRAALREDNERASLLADMLLVLRLAPHTVTEADLPRIRQGIKAQLKKRGARRTKGSRTALIHQLANIYHVHGVEPRASSALEKVLALIVDSHPDKDEDESDHIDTADLKRTLSDWRQSRQRWDSSVAPPKHGRPAKRP